MQCHPLYFYLYLFLCLLSSHISTHSSAHAQSNTEPISSPKLNQSDQIQQQADQALDQLIQEIDACYQQLDYPCVDQKLSQKISVIPTKYQQYQLTCFALLLAFSQEQESLVKTHIDTLIKLEIDIDFQSTPMKYLPSSVVNQIKLAKEMIDEKLKQMTNQQQQAQKALEKQLKQELEKQLLEAKKQQEEKLKAAQIAQEIIIKSDYQLYSSAEVGFLQTNGLDQALWQSGWVQSYAFGMLKNNHYQRKNGEQLRDERSFKLALHFNYIDLNSQVVYLEALKIYHLQLAYALDIKSIRLTQGLSTSLEAGARVGGEYTNPKALIRVSHHLGANIQCDMRWVWQFYDKVDLLVQASILQSFVVDRNQIAWSWFPIYSLGLRFPIMLLGG